MRAVEPAGDIGDADRERAAGESKAKGRHKKQRKAGHDRDRIDRTGGQQHQQREHAAAAEFIAQKAEKEPAKRAGQDRRRDQQTELGIVEAEFLLDPNADYRKQRPDREADCECHGR